MTTLHSACEYQVAAEVSLCVNIEPVLIRSARLPSGYIEVLGSYCPSTIWLPTYIRM